MVAQNKVRTYGVRYFELLRAFGDIDRVVKSDFLRYVTSYMRNMFWGTIVYKYHGRAGEYYLGFQFVNIVLSYSLF